MAQRCGEGSGGGCGGPGVPGGAGNGDWLDEVGMSEGGGGFVFRLLGGLGDVGGTRGVSGGGRRVSGGFGGGLRLRIFPGRGGTGGEGGEVSGLEGAAGCGLGGTDGDG